MPLQNRVTPFSTIEAVPHRGLFMGNRGRLHDEERRLVTTGWRSRAWLICVLEFRSRHQAVMAPGHYTELFFLDEAVALAAGHRLCAECRRADFRAFLNAWAGASEAPARAAALDAALHRERVARLRRHEKSPALMAAVPFGAFFVLPGTDSKPWVKQEDGAAAWSHAGYTGWARWPASVEVDVLTPAATLAALRAGYRPVLHPAPTPSEPRACSLQLPLIGDETTLRPSSCPASQPFTPRSLSSHQRQLPVPVPALGLTGESRGTRTGDFTWGGQVELEVPMSDLNLTPRSRVKRLPDRGRYDFETITSILDAGFLCHVGYVIDGQPYVTPTAYWRKGEHVYWHGSSASRMLRTLETGVDACLTVARVDGLVLARSAFHHSINYRSVMLFGKAQPVEGDDAKAKALEDFVERMFPGRWAELRPVRPPELKATTVLRMPIVEGSAKIRSGPPRDDEEDYSWAVWAGTPPIHAVLGAPIPD